MSIDIFISTCIITSLVGLFIAQPAAANTASKVIFCCKADNDLYRAAKDSGLRCSRYESPARAIDHAQPGSGVLILADDYPNTPTKIEPQLFDRAAEKKLRMYVEFPESVPGLKTGALQNIGWERAVVASDEFGAALPKLRILSISGCKFIPTSAQGPMLVMARVAGYDTAVYGLPQQVSPILFKMPERNLIVATTKLSGFISSRCAPAGAWKTVWEHIFNSLSPESPVSLSFAPTVHPAYGPDDKLPADVEDKAFKRGVDWYLNSRLLVSPDEKADIEELLKSGEEGRQLPADHKLVGDGSLGILEGYSAPIQYDGSQHQRVPLRADCNAEVAMALSLDTSNRSRSISKNLLDYVFLNSSMCTGARGNPKHPAFGLIAWGAISPAWERANYGDDNARVLLGTIIAAASLNSDRWDEHILRGLLANLRTTGKLGFRGDRIDVPDLEQNGWKAYADASPINCAPHFESYLWACYLWGYHQTGYKPFLEKTKTGIRIMMENYPDGWRWRDNIERARMLLCLAWLVRVENKPEHREWLLKVADDLLKAQQPCGAIQERIPPGGKGGHYNVPASNEAYGTGETPLIQTDGDPATDQLYTTGFALLGLHEAAAATGDERIREAEDRLVKFLCRIQVSSKEHPYLDGTWFRAFDFRRWDYWASSGDAGWGAWSAESGWGTAWINATLALRLKGQSVWDFTSQSHIASKFADVRKQMLQNDGRPWGVEQH